MFDYSYLNVGLIIDNESFMICLIITLFTLCLLRYVANSRNLLLLKVVRGLMVEILNFLVVRKDFLIELHEQVQPKRLVRSPLKFAADHLHY